MATEPAAAGLSLRVRLPGGKVEAISVNAHDLGARVDAALRPLKDLHGIPRDVLPRRADGRPLALQESLRAQGLRNGATLLLADPSKTRLGRSSEAEKIVLSRQDLEDQEREEEEVQRGEGAATAEEAEALASLLKSRAAREARAAELKDEANNALREQRFDNARSLYSAALALLPPTDSDDELAAALFANRALANLKLKAWHPALEDAERCLALRPEHTKARYRLGVAASELGQAEEARAAFRAVLAVEPDDRATRAALAALDGRRGSAGSRGSAPGMDAAAAAERAEGFVVAEKDMPEAVRWRARRLQAGYALPRFADVWREADIAAAAAAVDTAKVACLQHNLRRQPAVEAFFRASLLAIAGESRGGDGHSCRAPAGGLHLLILGAGGCAAATVCAEILAEASLPSGSAAALVEPSPLLARLCGHAAAAAGVGGGSGDGGGGGGGSALPLSVLQAAGQLDSEYAVPQEAMPPASAMATAAAAASQGDPPPFSDVILVSDRLSDDLLGERLVATLRAGRAAAVRAHPGSGGRRLRCVPSRAELLCAPLELRCGEAAGGCDLARVNALRFSAHRRPEARTAPGARSWKCGACSWSNPPDMKQCEVCKAKRQAPGLQQGAVAARGSHGWWPLDLDQECARTDVCRACAREQVVCSFDFDDPERLEQEMRRTSRTLEMEVTDDCRLNAMAVWWRLHGPGGASVSSCPGMMTGRTEGGSGAEPAAVGDAAWSGRRQAVFYFGFEIGVQAGERLTFSVELSEDASRLKFDLVAPRLTERMGLVKFDCPVTSMGVMHELKEKLDFRTNRLKAGIPGAGLARRDKLLSFGPFEVMPGVFQSHIWERVEDRIRLHADKPLMGDRPITCVFSRGAYEGTVRWPEPRLAEGSNVPRLPAYFEAWRGRRRAPYVRALDRALSLFLPLLEGGEGEAAAAAAASPSKPRVLEIGCGPAPALAIYAALRGARAWASEQDPSLRELAAETVRDMGLEMVSEHKGLPGFSFFGKPMRPEDPAVRVLRAGPAAALVPGPATPRLLDGGRADVVVAVAPPGGGSGGGALLGEDYLLTMWHAASSLLALASPPPLQGGGADGAGAAGRPPPLLLPSALVVRGVAVGWLPLVGGAALQGEVLGGRSVQASPSDVPELRPLAAGRLPGAELLRIDLAERPKHGGLPCVRCDIVAERAGLLTGVAFWHVPDFGELLGRGAGDAAVEDEVEEQGGIDPYAQVTFLLRPRHVAANERIPVELRFEDHELRLFILEGGEEVGGAGAGRS